MSATGSDIERVKRDHPSYVSLRDNTFAIVESDGTQEEKISRILALIPMWMRWENEARETISRLRTENDELWSAVTQCGHCTRVQLNSNV